MSFRKTCFYLLVELTILLALWVLVQPIAPVLGRATDPKIDNPSVLETWLSSSINISLSTTETHPYDFQEATDQLQVSNISSYTRLVFYVALSPAPTNLSVTVTLGSWVRRVCLFPTNCSFYGWVDVSFDIPWPYSEDKLLVMPLRVQAYLIDEEGDANGWLGRIQIRSFASIYLTQAHQEIPLQPQNQSQIFGSPYWWYNYDIMTEGRVVLPTNTSNLGISIDIEANWVGVKATSVRPIFRAYIAGQWWDKRVYTDTNSSSVRFEGEISPLTLEESLTVFFEMKNIRGTYINVNLRAWIQVWNLTSSSSMTPTSPSPFGPLISPTLIVILIVIPGGLLGGRAYHYRKWRQKQENIEETVMSNIMEET